MHAAETAASSLANALGSLLDEFHSHDLHSRHRKSSGHAAFARRILQADTWSQLRALHNLLCRRPATPELPPKALQDIEIALSYDSSHRIFHPTSSIPPRSTVASDASVRPTPIRLSLWKGDITSLSEVTAIVNAANSQMLGCFVPEHACIDNVIHAVAGPRLRTECARLMAAQEEDEPVGSAKVTPGFNLQSKYVLHTVGPQLRRGQEPEEKDVQGLASCYISCLEAAETLPALEDGRKVLAFCCISTGVFAFPGERAAKIATRTVLDWCQKHPKTSLTDVVFVVYGEQDQNYYTQTLQQAMEAGQTHPYQTLQPSPHPHPLSHPNLTLAREWLEQADTLIISAGAGLSAADGLDYTSRPLFTARFPNFLKYGLERLYDVFGYQGWPSKLVKWGYYFTHLSLVRAWAASPLYASLLALTTRYGDDRHFVRTSNADGLFVANGFDPDRISTPQGQYALLQCSRPCRAHAVWPSAPFIDAALPFLDPETQALTNAACIPRCAFCGAELTLCVRGGGYFLEPPFLAQEEKYQAFLDEIAESDRPRSAVILELGVGTNTAGVLRWPNEELVEAGGGRFKLIRVGLGAAGCAPWELERMGVAVGVQGDIGDVLGGLRW